MVLILAGAAPAAAQQNPAPTSARTWQRQVAHYGKWAAVAGAVAFTAFALEQHHRSDQAWNTLIGICQANSQNCSLGADGRYVNYTSELDYQLAIYYDHRARWRLIAGQVSLLAAVGMFVVDRRRGTGTPDNIPYHAVDVTLAPTIDGARMGLRIAF